MLTFVLKRINLLKTKWYDHKSRLTVRHVLMQDLVHVLTGLLFKHDCDLEDKGNSYDKLNL